MSLTVRFDSSSLPSLFEHRLTQTVPWVANVFLKLISPFIDPITREKLHFNEEVNKYVPKQQLWTELGGDVNFEYDHAQYWPALTALCKERSNERKARWEAAGGHIGESEMYMRGGDAPSIAQGQAPKAEMALVDEQVAVPATGPVPTKLDGTANTPAAPVSAPVVVQAETENQKHV